MAQPSDQSFLNGQTGPKPLSVKCNYQIRANENFYHQTRTQKTIINKLEQFANSVAILWK